MYRMFVSGGAEGKTVTTESEAVGVTGKAGEAAEIAAEAGEAGGIVGSEGGVAVEGAAGEAGEAIEGVAGKGKIRIESAGESGSASNVTFATEDKLMSHFEKHGAEFKGVYNSADEYLQGARSVMNNGYKVEYSYKGGNCSEPPYSKMKSE